MTAADLVHDLEARHLQLRVDGDELVIRPGDRLTPGDISALRKAKADVLAYLRGRALGTDWSRVSLWSLNHILEIVVPWSDTRLVIAPGCRVAQGLRAIDPQPGRIWCVCEVSDLLLSGVAPEDVRAVAEANLGLDARVTGVRKAGGP